MECHLCHYFPPHIALYFWSHCINIVLHCTHCTALVLAIEHFLLFSAERIKYPYCPLQSWPCVHTSCLYNVHSQYQRKKVPICVLFLLFISDSSHSILCHMGHVHMIHHRHFTLIWYNGSSEWRRKIDKENEWFVRCYWYHTLTCCHVNNIIISSAV